MLGGKSRSAVILLGDCGDWGFGFGGEGDYFLGTKAGNNGGANKQWIKQM